MYLTSQEDVWNLYIRLNTPPPPHPPPPSPPGYWVGAATFMMHINVWANTLFAFPPLYLYNWEINVD